MAKFWYAYNNVGDPFDASSYAKFNLPNKPSCTNGKNICAIYASGSTVNISPDFPFSINLQQYIILALSDSEIPQPRGTGARPFVYLKD